MAKQPRTMMSGKDARYILKQNSVNLAWLAEKIGISPQALNSRLNADVFSRQNMIEINQIMKKDIFGIGEKPAEVLEYCIGQSMKDGRPIFNYLKVMRRHADNAIRTILDALSEPAGDPHEPPANP